VVKMGDEVMVKVIGIDNSGRINLSRKAVFERFSNLPGAKVRNSSAPKERQRKFVHSHDRDERRGNCKK